MNGSGSFHVERETALCHIVYNVNMVTMSKTIRVDEETYRKLMEYTGRLQAEYKRQVSLDETIRYLAEDKRHANRISDLAGSWRVTDEEVEDIRKSLAEGWRNWRLEWSA